MKRKSRRPSSVRSASPNKVKYVQHAVRLIDYFATQSSVSPKEIVLALTEREREIHQLSARVGRDWNGEV